MPFSALHDELVNDPAGMGYAGKSHQQMSDLLTGRHRFAGRNHIDADMALSYMIRVGAWAHLRLLAENAGTPVPQRVAAINFRDMLIQLDRIQTAYADDFAAYGALLDAIVAAGVITPLQRTALISMPDSFFDRVSELQMQGVYLQGTSAADVEAALNEIGD